MVIDWQKLAVSSSMSLLDTMKVIEQAALRFALVVDEGVLVGVVTDGDIRRTLLRTGDLHTSVRLAINHSPIVGVLDEGPSAWRRTLSSSHIELLPIVDNQRHIQRLVTKDSCIVPRNNKVVILAGGLGMRLRPLTEDIPKPMIKIGGTPILETIIRTLADEGFRQFYLSVNYRAEVIETHFRDGTDFGVEIHYLHEEKRLGTAGPISLLPNIPNDPLLVMNGDILTSLHYGDLIDKHVVSQAMATVCVRPHTTQIQYGVVEVDDGFVHGIREKPTIHSLVSAGIYALSPEALALVPRDKFFDMPELIGQIIHKNLPVRPHIFEDYWIDVGHQDDLERARLKFESKQ